MTTPCIKSELGLSAPNRLLWRLFGMPATSKKAAFAAFFAFLFFLKYLPVPAGGLLHFAAGLHPNRKCRKITHDLDKEANLLAGNG
jgi:hypothetical protein